MSRWAPSSSLRLIPVLYALGIWTESRPTPGSTRQPTIDWDASERRSANCKARSSNDQLRPTDQGPSAHWSGGTSYACRNNNNYVHFLSYKVVATHRLISLHRCIHACINSCNHLFIRSSIIATSIHSLIHCLTDSLAHSSLSLLTYQNSELTKLRQRSRDEPGLKMYTQGGN